MSVPSPCPNDPMHPVELDHANPDLAFCPRCNLQYRPVPVFEETRQPYKDGD